MSAPTPSSGNGNNGNGNTSGNGVSGNPTTTPAGAVTGKNQLFLKSNKSNIPNFS
jgi:hypothetical protein